MSKQTIGAGKVHKLRPDKEAKIEPLDGWSVQTKYGTLRLHDGTDCVRLQDVHSWMCSNGNPPKQAVYAVFGALLDAAGEVDSGDFENLDTLFALRLVNASAAPVPVFVQVNSCRWDSDPYKCECMKVVTVWQMHPVGPIEKEVFSQRFILPVALSKTRDVQFLKSAFPDLGHVHFEDDTPGGFIYAIGEGAARVWFGAVDIESDHLAAHDAKKSREADAKHQVRWPKDEALFTLLARLAVPVAVAHKLWGWGRVVAVQAGAQSAPAITPPAGWRDELELDHGRSKARYFQKADAKTPLVRIVDVLADFAARHGLPAGEAVGAFLAAVNVPLLSEVYWLKENHFAELVGAAHMYGQLTEAEAQKKTREAADYADEMRWDEYGAAGSVFKGVTTPLEALKQHIQEYGPRTSDKSLYAISHVTANGLWGWGEVVAAQAETQAAPAEKTLKLSGWDQVVSIKKANKDAGLTHEQKKVVAAEFARRKDGGATGIAKAMASELGISVTAFNILKQAKPGKRETKNNWIVLSGEKAS
jgi:hypothetical protein